jgi:hypothetical protein
VPSDAAYGAPQSGGGGGGIKARLDANPALKWGLVVGAVLAAWWLWKKRQAAASTAASGGGLSAGTGTTVSPTSTDGSGQVSFDPGTGVPIAGGGGGGTDMNQVGSPSSDLTKWTASAYQSLVNGGVDPLAADSALYNLLNDVPLSPGQRDILNKAFGGAGMPPGGPYNVTDQPPPDNPAPPGPGSDKDHPPADLKGYTWVWTGAGWVPVPIPVTPPPPGSPPPPLSLMQQFVNSVYAYLHRTTGYKGPTFTQAQITAATGDVKAGKATLPGGFSAPAGYILNPTTRILTRDPNYKGPATTTTASGGIIPTPKAA